MGLELRGERTWSAILVLSLGAAIAGCPGSHPPPTSCRSSRECSAAGLVCDTESMTCVECNVDDDCLFTDRICRAHACVDVVSCVSSRECPGLVCDLSLGYCVECVTDTDCPTGEVCEGSVCETAPTPCGSDRDCSGMGLVCDFDRMICVECVRDADCPGGEVCRSSVCRPSGVDGGPPGLDAGRTDVGMPPATEDLDLLMMVDDSNSMADEQALLGSQLSGLVRTLGTGDRDGDGVADFTPVGSLHVGIVTSDMGAGPALPPGMVVPSCDPGLGDDGILRTSGRTGVAGCVISYPPVFEFRSGVDDPTTFARDVSCVAVMGTGGCGFEQQLEAVLKALSPTTATPWVAPGYVAPVFAGGTVGHGDRENEGFLRTSSVLAVLLVTDEEDCSVPDYSLFYDDPRFSSAVLNLRCFTFPEELYPTRRYVDGLLQLRTFPSRLVYAGFVGVPTDIPGSTPEAYERILDDPRMVERPDPATGNTRLVSSCTTADGGFAFPPRRMVSIARDLAERGAHTTIQSICAPDFRGATGAFVDQLALALSGR